MKKSKNKKECVSRTLQNSKNQETKQGKGGESLPTAVNVQAPPRLAGKLDGDGHREEKREGSKERERGKNANRDGEGEAAPDPPLSCAAVHRRRTGGGKERKTKKIKKGEEGSVGFYEKEEG